MDEQQQYQLNQLTNQVSAHHKWIADHAQKAEQEELKKKADAISDNYIKTTSVIFEKATAYNNVIMLAGYAGAFTLLTKTKEVISGQLFVFAAFLLGFSLFVFCAWVIGQMIYTSNNTMKAAKTLTSGLAPAEFLQQLELMQKNGQKVNLVLGKIWFPVLLLTIIPSVVAVFIMFYHYLLFITA